MLFDFESLRLPTFVVTVALVALGFLAWFIAQALRRRKVTREDLAIAKLRQIEVKRWNAIKAERAARAKAGADAQPPAP